LLAESFGCCRWFWNYALNLCQETYKNTGKGLTRGYIQGLLPNLKKEFEWLKDPYSQCLQVVRQDTHLDSLAERLREDRVRAIIQPILSGLEIGDTPEDDRRYLLDLGLVVRSQEGGLKIANPIYQEVIPRVLSPRVYEINRFRSDKATTKSRI
jgi:hypothetical protein